MQICNHFYADCSLLAMVAVKRSLDKEPFILANII